MEEQAQQQPIQRPEKSYNIWYLKFAIRIVSFLIVILGFIFSYGEAFCENTGWILLYLFGAAIIMSISGFILMKKENQLGSILLKYGLLTFGSLVVVSIFTTFSVQVQCDVPM